MRCHIEAGFHEWEDASTSSADDRDDNAGIVVLSAAEYILESCSGLTAFA